MKLKPVLESLCELTSQATILRGITDEGRIFALGTIDSGEHLASRVISVVDGLREHVGQPFENHPWSYSFDISTFRQDAVSALMTMVGVVCPQADGSIFVKDYILLPRGLHPVHQFQFEHTPNGTILTPLEANGRKMSTEDRAASCLYPLAIAILNTRGCTIDFKNAPSVANVRRKRQGKHPIPAHYDVDATEYITALYSPTKSTDRDGTHASPLPHLRRAHPRNLSTGQRIWVRSALVNVRKEGDIAFVERRQAYRQAANRKDAAH